MATTEEFSPLVSASEFSPLMVRFQAPVKFSHGFVIDISYGDDETQLVMALPAARVPFDCGKGKIGEKLELNVEIPNGPQFQDTRKALKGMENAFRTHVSKCHADIIKAVGGGVDSNNLSSGAKNCKLLRPSPQPGKYPDYVNMKWKPTEQVDIKGPDRNPIGWEEIKRNATVTACIHIKGVVFSIDNKFTFQVQPVFLIVVVAQGAPIVPKKRVVINTALLFEDEKEPKRSRIDGPSTEENDN